MEFPIKVNICYIINSQGEVLLQKKSRGFGEGNWNGPGGKIEKDEKIEDSVLREIKEETNLDLKNIKKGGEIEFVYSDKNLNRYCYVFICRDYDGELKDMGEGELRWFRKNNIPLKQMWDDDKYWLLDVLNGKVVYKRFYFNEEKKVIKHCNI